MTEDLPNPPAKGLALARDAEAKGHKVTVNHSKDRYTVHVNDGRMTYTVRWFRRYGSRAWRLLYTTDGVLEDEPLYVIRICLGLSDSRPRRG